MEISDILKGGENRVSLSALGYIAVMTSIVGLLTYLVTIPTKTLSTNAKRAISIPILLVNFFFPAFLKVDIGFVACGMGLASFASLMRFIELIWTGPFIYGRDAYVPIGYLHEELWKPIRTFYKPESKDIASKEKYIEQENVKDKRYYDIILAWIGNAIICDICTSFSVTYTMKDIEEINSNISVASLLFHCLTIILFTTVFNTLAYPAQLIYVLYYEGGSYSSKEWRPLAKNPILAKSLNEFWAPRWHRIARSPMVNLVYKPVYDFSKRFFSKFIKNPAPLARAAGVFGVFVISGVMHEFIFVWNIGWPVYKERFLGVHMTQFILFGVVLPLELLVGHIASKKIPEFWRRSSITLWIRRFITSVLLHILIYPVLENFHYLGIRYSLPFKVLRPYIHEAIHKFPLLKVLCGSDI